MQKQQIVAILNEIATLLEIQGENSFKVRAYSSAARTVEQLDRELTDLIATGELGDLPGIGDTLKEKITTLVTTGSLPYHDELKQKVPAGLFNMLRVDGLGPKKVKALYDELHIDDLDKLKAACENGSVAKLKGFGAKTQEKILKGLEYIRLTGDRVRIDQALPIALRLIEELKKLPEVQRIELCGSLRRRRETIKDVDILVSSSTPGPIMDHFVRLPGVVSVVGQGETKTSVVLDVGTPGRQQLINADLRVVKDEAFPFALHHFTGSKEHNVAMRARAQQKFGLKMSEYGVESDQQSIKAKDERELFQALGLAFIPPEMRENTGEIEAAELNQVPQLLEIKDIRGVFHNHSTWSDGKHSLEEMARAAKALGFEYFGIGDHSKSLTVANGLTVERVHKQQAEVDALNRKLKGIHIFKGIECDILANGDMDYTDDVLASFDYVVASVHSHFNQSKEEMTTRILKAIRHPHVTMLGHATGRLLLSRDAYQVDLDAVLQEAARCGTMIEINAQPMRLDLDWVHCKRARALGVMLVINPDAHSTGELGLFAYGVDVARRGWLEAQSVFNTRSLAEVQKELARRKQRANSGA